MTDFRRELKMQLAVQKLTKYFGLLTIQDLANVIASSIRNETGGSLTTDVNTLVADIQSGNEIADLSTVTDDDRILSEIITYFLDQSLGCYTTQELLQHLAERMQINDSGPSEPTGEDAEQISTLRERYSNLFHIVSDAQFAHVMPYPIGYERMKDGSIKRLINDSEPGLLATGGQAPTKGKPGLSAILSNTGRITTANRYVNSACIFLNSIPAIEMSKAIPYLEVNILVPSRAVQISGERLVAPTIYKFLLGSSRASPGTVLEDLSLANEEIRPGTPGSEPTTTSSTPGEENSPEPIVYTNVGMEAFLMPQTLVNPNAAQNSANFGNPVLDKFRPFLSVKEFSVDARLTYAANMYHTARMSLTLHDRSRLNEIAEFVKPEIRGSTELIIEYGWCHGESEYNTNPNNVWAAIINGMRKREKYNIVNSSFSFDDSGQVDITLELATAGEAATTVEPVTNDVNVRPILEEINRAVDLIGRLRLSIPALNPRAGAAAETSGESGASARPSTVSEIRGIQFLNSTQDVFSNLTLSREQREEFRNLLSSLNALPQADDIRRLRTLLTQLYGDGSTRTRSRGPNRTSESALTERLRSQIRNEIRRKIENLKKGLQDPFLVGTYNPIIDRRNRALNTPGRPRMPTTGSLTGAQERAAAYETLVSSRQQVLDVSQQQAIAARQEYNRLQGIATTARRGGGGPNGARGTVLGLLETGVTAIGAMMGAATQAEVDESIQRNSGEYEQAVANRQGIEAVALENAAQRAQDDYDRALSEAQAAGERLTTASGSLETERAGYRASQAAWRSRIAASSPVPRGAVSLANLLLVFMGQPLAATNQFDDIQFIFYPFNRYAGYASRINIANFIINVEDFIDKYTEYRLQNVTRNGVFTIRQFWTFLTSQIIDDPAQDSYGLRDDHGALYRRPTIDRDSDESASSSRSTISQPADSDGARFTARLNALLANVTPDGSFRQPQLQFELECLPGRINSEIEIEDTALEKSILRVHIYDQQYTPYDGLGSILQAQRNATVSVRSNPVGASTPDGTSIDTSIVELNAMRYNQETLNRAIRNGIVTRITDDRGNTTYEVVGGPEALKRFIYQTTPYIIYGSQNSLVKGANLASMTNQEAATIAMVNGPTNNGLTRPDGQDVGNIPMQILPVELSIDIFGCPLIYSATQFFIDFGTNTTADDIYAVTGIEHKISLGDFSTNLKFRALSSYGQYRNYIQDLQTAETQLREYEERITGEPAADVSAPQTPRRRRRRPPRAVATTSEPTTPTVPGGGTLPVSGVGPVPSAIPDTPRIDLPDPERTASAAATEAERSATQTVTDAQRRQREIERQTAEARAAATGRLPASPGAGAPPSSPGLSPPSPPTMPTTYTDIGPRPGRADRS